MSEESLSSSLGIPDNEPEEVEAPEITPGGKVVEGKEEKEERTVTLKGEEIERLEWFQNQMKHYAKIDEKTGEVSLDMEKVIEAEGYDTKYLVKKGEKPSFMTEEQVAQEAKGKGEEKVAEDPLKDKLGSEDVKELIRVEAEKLVSERMKPLEKSERTRMLADSVYGLRARYEQFQPLEADISKYIQEKKITINSPQELEDIFLRVAGVKSIQSTGHPGSGAGTSGGNRGTPRGRSRDAQTPDEVADSMLKDMQTAGHVVDGVEDSTMQELFGKSRLSPLPRDGE